MSLRSKLERLWTPILRLPVSRKRTFRLAYFLTVVVLSAWFLIGQGIASAQEAKPPASAKSGQGTQEKKAPPPPDAATTAPAPVSPPAPAATAPPSNGVLSTPFGPINVVTPTPAASAQQSSQQSGAAAQVPGSTDKQKEQSPPLPQGAAIPAPPSATQEQSNPQVPAPSSPSQPEAQTEKKSTNAVALNLENADLYQVLRIIGSELKINYVVDPSVKGTVTINTSGLVSREDLFSVLQSILQINGAAIVKGDGYYRVVPIADAKMSALPLEFAKAPEAAVGPGETMVLQVVPMRFVTAAEMSKVLAPFVTPAGEIVLNDRANILLIVETPAKLKQIGEIVNIFDSPRFSRERVHLFPITSNTAKTLIPELQNVFAGYALSGTSAIRFVPIESLNAILAISPSPEVFQDVGEWIKRLDQPPKELGVQDFVYPVQNAKASDLRDILIQLYGGEVPKPQPLPASTTPRDPMIPPEALAEQQRQSAPPALERVQGRLHFMSDDKNNALIIQASPRDYEIVKRTIAQLDILQRQVLIDAKIYEVDLTGDLSLGVSAFLQNNSSLKTPPATLGSYLGGQAGGTFQLQTFALIGATRTLQMFLTATDNHSRVRMLSSPSILVTDNSSARIQVGASVPVPIGSALTPIQAGGTSLFAQTIQYMDTGVILTVTPHVNASGIVMLTISQEVSSAVPNSTSQIVAPVINKNSFQTSVVLSDGEPLALGGIITTNVTSSQNRVPFFGNIPYLGPLFGTTTKNTTHSEIVLLLTPHVLRDVPAAAASTEDFVSKMHEVEKSMKEKN